MFSLLSDFPFASVNYTDNYIHNYIHLFLLGYVRKPAGTGGVTDTLSWRTADADVIALH